jgi:hypothetical protein
MVFMLELELLKLYSVPDNIFAFMQVEESYFGRYIQQDMPNIPDDPKASFESYAIDEI